MTVLTKEQYSKMGKKGGTAFRHIWTEEEKGIVRMMYKGTNKSAIDIANRLTVLTGEKITLYAVKGQVQQMGLAIDKSRRWTEREKEKLAELMGKNRPEVVARLLRRSVNSVQVMAKRLSCGKRVRDGWYTKREVSEICGVDHHKTQQWIDKGILKASFEHGARPQKDGSRCWHINEADLREFFIQHSYELTGRNVDLFQMVNILIGDR